MRDATSAESDIAPKVVTTLGWCALAAAATLPFMRRLEPEIMPVIARGVRSPFKNELLPELTEAGKRALGFFEHDERSASALLTFSKRLGKSAGRKLPGSAGEFIRGSESVLSREFLEQIPLIKTRPTKKQLAEGALEITSLGRDVQAEHKLSGSQIYHGIIHTDSQAFPVYVRWGIQHENALVKSWAVEKLSSPMAHSGMINIPRSVLRPWTGFENHFPDHKFVLQMLNHEPRVGSKWQDTFQQRLVRSLWVQEDAGKAIYNGVTKTYLNGFNKELLDRNPVLARQFEDAFMTRVRLRENDFFDGNFAISLGRNNALRVSTFDFEAAFERNNNLIRSLPIKASQLDIEESKPYFIANYFGGREISSPLMEQLNQSLAVLRKRGPDCIAPGLLQNRRPIWEELVDQHLWLLQRRRYPDWLPRFF